MSYSMLEVLKNVLFISVIAVGVGGIFLFIINWLTTAIVGVTGLATIVGAGFALVVLTYVIIKSEIDEMQIAELVLAVVGIVFVGEIILLIAPWLSPYLLTGSAFEWLALAWLLVALGIALEIKEYLTG